MRTCHPSQVVSLHTALLALCAGNSPVPGEFPTQRPVTRIFDVFCDLRLNKRLSKQSRGWWFETLSCPFWRHCNVAYQNQECFVFRWFEKHALGYIFKDPAFYVLSWDKHWTTALIENITYLTCDNVYYNPQHIQRDCIVLCCVGSCLVFYICWWIYVTFSSY